MKIYLFSLLTISSAFLSVCAQTLTTDDSLSKDSVLADTLSKFAQFNKKAEHLFKIIPVRIISYSNETGSVFGQQS